MKICGLIAISACYWFASKWITTPEEQIHFFQYGLVGILFSFALKNHFPSRIFTNFSALALATLAGWIDELIQGYLPSRHYDVHDIILNAISALLGLLVLQLFTETHLKKNI